MEARRNFLAIDGFGKLSYLSYKALLLWKELPPVTKKQLANSSRPHDAFIRQKTRPSLVQMIGCPFSDANGIIETNACLFLVEPLRTNFGELSIHWGLVTHTCVTKGGQRVFRKWHVAKAAPIHYLNQCRLIVKWAHGGIFQWNLNPNTFPLKKKKYSVICKLSSILFLPRCVDKNTCFIHANEFENTVFKLMSICLGFRVLTYFR